MHRLLGLVLLLATAGLAATATVARGDDAPAADLAAKVADLEVRVAKDAAAKDDSALAKDAEAALALADPASDAAVRKRLVDVIGRILSASHASTVERPAIQTLGRLADPAGFAHLRRFLRIPTSDELDAALKMGGDGSVASLLAVIGRTKMLYEAVTAMKALAEFGTHPGVREVIVKELTASIRRDRPGVGRGRKGTREVSRIRYEALAGEMCATLNRLTGQNVASPEDWFDIVEKYKSNLGVLFAGKPVAVAAPVAQATPEVVARVEALEKEAAGPHPAKSDAELIASAVSLASATRDPAVRARLADVVGAIIEHTPDDALYGAGVKALGEIGDPKSFRFLRSRWTWEGADPRLDAIEAAAAGRSPDAVPVLLNLVERADGPVAVAAIHWLAKSWRDKDVREGVLLGIVDAMARAREAPDAFASRPTPCRPGSPGVDGDSAGRYTTLAWEMTEALNAMTGRDLPNPGSWFDLVAEHRKEPAALFLDK